MVLKVLAFMKKKKPDLMAEYLLAILQIFYIWQEKINNVIPSIPLGIAGVTFPKEVSKVMETNSQK